MKLYFRLSALLLLLIFTACKSDDLVIALDEAEAAKDKEFRENPRYAGLKSDYIYDDDKLHTFELNLPEAALAQLDADPGAEEYVEGSLTFEGETLEAVGIRYKGSLGAFVNCVSGGIENGPQGFKTCRKLSMKVKVNWNDDDTRFYGVKKLLFHSQNFDDTKMRERLAYHLYRAMGVPAPRSTHARLVVNGEFVGLFAFTEQIDGRFTRFNFDDGKNNLYKEIWPIDGNGEGYPEQAYIDLLKSNRDENPSAALIASFGQEIAAATDNTELKEVIENRMDLDKIMSLLVVDNTIRNDDGPMHFYCDDTNCGNHNYYWYEEVSRNKLHLIPWDMDSAMENIEVVTNPYLEIVDSYGETSSDCQPFTNGVGANQRSAACDKLIQGWVSYQDEYQSKVDQFKSGPFSAAQVNPLLDKWSAQIKDAVIEASEVDDTTLDEGSWEFRVDELKSQLEFARNN